MPYPELSALSQRIKTKFSTLLKSCPVGQLSPDQNYFKILNNITYAKGGPRFPPSLHSVPGARPPMTNIIFFGWGWGRPLTQVCNLFFQGFPCYCIFWHKKMNISHILPKPGFKTIVPRTSTGTTGGGFLTLNIIKNYFINISIYMNQSYSN